MTQTGFLRLCLSKIVPRMNHEGELRLGSDWLPLRTVHGLLIQSLNSVSASFLTFSFVAPANILSAVTSGIHPWSGSCCSDSLDVWRWGGWVRNAPVLYQLYLNHVLETFSS